MINSENRITLKNINYGVNNKPFFKNLSTDISTNGITVILGPNGSGKTLLTKIIKGLIKPESGELSIKLNGILSFFLFDKSTAVILGMISPPFST